MNPANTVNNILKDFKKKITQLAAAEKELSEAAIADLRVATSLEFSAEEKKKEAFRASTVADKLRALIGEDNPEDVANDKDES